MKTYDIAIIGGGFSGLMVFAHLAAQALAGTRVAIFEPAARLGTGLAYATPHTCHLLNVNAGGMSAYPDRPTHLLEFLASTAGRDAARGLGVGESWSASDYIPRALYACYLDNIAATAMETAQARGLTADHIRTTVNGVDGKTITAADGNTYQATRILLALGNQAAVRDDRAHVISDIFGFDFFSMAGVDAPVAIIGNGLTMVDTVLALRKAGYIGKITGFSRRGLLPHVHDEVSYAYTSRARSFAEMPHNLLDLMRAFRAEARETMAACGSWQPVFKEWRPYLPALWAGLSLRDKKRFLSSLFTLWNIHRHRMAGQIGAVVADELARGTLVLAKTTPVLTAVDRGIRVVGGGQNFVAAKVFDCRGPGYDVTRTDNPLLQSMLATGTIAPHPTGWGIMPSGQIDAVGTLLVGERLETTAVPELRVQAQDAAIRLCS